MSHKKESEEQEGGAPEPIGALHWVEEHGAKMADSIRKRWANRRPKHDKKG